jgi:Subtilase family
MSRPAAFNALSIVGLLLTTPVVAGNNVGATARLSWSADAEVSNVDSLPANPLPLYLLLSGAQDVQALAVDIRWTPNDLFGNGYHIGAGSQEQGCGSITTDEPGDFQGDTTYSWSIIFPEGMANRNCVTYLVYPLLGDTAAFCLISVKTKDSNGAVDHLDISGNATIRGGNGAQCPPVAQSVFPHATLPGETAAFDIQGVNFTPDTRVELLNHSVPVSASQVVVTNSRNLVAHVAIPPGFAGPIEVVVQNAITADTLSGMVSVPASLSDYHPNHVVVKFVPGAVAMPPGVTEAGTGSLTASVELQALLTSAGISSLRMLTPTATETNLAGLDRSQLDIYVCELPETSVDDAIAVLLSDAVHVLSAERDWAIYPASVPGDTRFSEQWWLRNTGQFNGVIGEDLRATSAWDRTMGGITHPTAMDVVLLDYEVDGTHPDLEGRVIAGPDFVPDGFGSPPDHGTSVAAIIGAPGNGGGDVVGVNWRSSIVSVIVSKPSGPGGSFGHSSSLYAGVDWARTQGYKIVNVSQWAYEYFAAGEPVFRNAWASGVAVFAAAGNRNCACTSYPAGYYPFTIPVGGIDDLGLRYDDHNVYPDRIPGSPPGGSYGGSEWGPHIRFLAPGGPFMQTARLTTTGSYYNVGTFPGGQGFGGTSAAAAIASGVGSLLQSVAIGLSNVELTGEDIVEVLSRTARDKGASGWDQFTGWGAIDADAATAMLWGQQRIEHGAPAGMSDVGSSYIGDVFVQNWQGLPSGLYKAFRHTMQVTRPFGTGYIAPPTVWVRAATSMGASFIPNPLNADNLTRWIPAAWTTGVGTSNATFNTYVFNLQPYGGGAQGWWPTTPAGAQLSYTAVGPVSTLDVDNSVTPNAIEFGFRPNPAGLGSMGRFRIGVSIDSEVELKVFDLVGRRVRTLASGPHLAGIREIVWDLRDDVGNAVGSGVYLAQLRTTASRKVMKVVVAR